MTWLQIAITAAVGIILLAVAVYDYRTREIPDRLHLALLPLAVAAVWVFPQVSLASRGVGVFIVSVPMLGLAMLKENAFGGGDIKLMAVCGFLLGWQNTLTAFILAVLLGGTWAVFLLAAGRGKKGQAMAFGPALCAGVFAAFIWGAEITAWYNGLLMR